MRYLINNVWYWRARLVVEEMEIGENQINARVMNHGHASTSNATFHYSNAQGEVLWHSENFGVNATNESIVALESLSPF